MCGIAGFLTDASDGRARELAEVSSAMDACLQHRGPDGSQQLAEALGNRAKLPADATS